MPFVDISGTVDIHIHTAPSLIPRAGTDIDQARDALANNFKAILVKSHFESTVGRAALAHQAVPGIPVFGALVLNNFAGGINPVAVENAVRLGAKQIYMPTLDSAAHIRQFGSGGAAWAKFGGKTTIKPLTILDSDGKLLPETKDIVSLVKEADIILGTAHLSRDEIVILANYCKQEKLQKLVITHPYFSVPCLSLDDQKALHELGAWLEFCPGNMWPIPGVARFDDFVASFNAIGFERVIVSSDTGPPRKSSPAETMRVFGQCLLDKGFDQVQVDTLLKLNPARLLNIQD
jgi:hypothetical protein